MKPASAICFLLGRSDLILLQLQAVPDLAVNACSKIALRLRNLVLEVAVIDVLDHASVGHIVFLSLYVGLHVRRRHEPHVVAECLQLARPIV